MAANLPEFALHTEAAKRVDERARAILPTIRALPSSPSKGPDFHPVNTITDSDIHSADRFILEQDPTGTVSGVRWISQGMWVGWTDTAFKPIKALVDDLANRKPFRDVISQKFLLQEAIKWLSETLEHSRSDAFPEFITLRSTAAVRQYDIWIPLARTFALTEFNIGDVAFRVFTKQIMDEWWNRITPKIRDAGSIGTLNEWRSELQAHLAACISVRAEQRMAVEIARAKAKNAAALLRFLSPANVDSRLASCCTPAGSQSFGIVMEVFMNGGCVGEMSRGTEDQRSLMQWLVDKSRAHLPGVLENLHRLASDLSTEFSRSLYDALILYSRQTLAVEVSDKLVFALSALESMLLRDSNEPIQKNLGERIAFLIGQSAPQRKEILKNIEETYKIRSAFVHHGQTARHVDTVDRFLVNAWATFSRLLDLVPKYRTKSALIGALEDLKMS